jgi:hypothetical protein
MEWPGPLETVREVDIETSRAPDSPPRRTPIWIVVEGGDVFIRSLRGSRGRWYRDLVANPKATLHVDGEAVPVRAVDASDPESVERATAGLRNKYPASRSLDSMLRDEMIDATLRLEPRE